MFNGFEQFHDIAGRVFAQDLAAAWTVGDVVAEPGAVLVQRGDEAGEILDLKDASVPAAGSDLVR